MDQNIIMNSYNNSYHYPDQKLSNIYNYDTLLYNIKINLIYKIINNLYY